MAQGSLSRLATAASVAAFGVACEFAAHAAPAWAVLDLAVGCVAAAGGALLLGRASWPAALAVLFAVLWFCGTLSGAVFALTYRGPLLQLLLTVAPKRQLAIGIAAAGWVASLLPFGAASPLTCAAAAAAAALLLSTSRLAAADARGAAPIAGLTVVALAIVWSVAASGAGSSGVLLVLNDVTVVVAVAVALTAASGYFAREAERALVIELGPTRHPGLPLTTRLSRALADRELQVRYLVPDLGWVDERGRDVSPPPDTHHITRAVAPGGGEVALVHSGRAGSDTRLAHAAASAAALSLEAARLDAEVRSRAREVEQSRRRLLSAVDEERRMLEERLRDLVLMRLGGVDRMLAGHGELERERRELRVAVDELVALGRGLYPPTLARTDLERGLRETGRRLRLPLRVTVTGDASAVPDAYRAAAWFVCSEALTNVARHASATSVAVRLDVSERELSVEVEDDGRGGATLERGLRGLADRVEALGGRFTLSSPPGGPTRIRAVLVL